MRGGGRKKAMYDMKHSSASAVRFKVGEGTEQKGYFLKLCKQFTLSIYISIILYNP